jgi:hypothetical protein
MLEAVNWTTFDQKRRLNFFISELFGRAIAGRKSVELTFNGGWRRRRVFGEHH